MANLKLKENLDIKSTGVTTSGKNALPKTGDIIPFAGTVAPTGWVICDGTNGTPDLRGLFIVGAAASGNIGATYGNAAHNHTTSVAAYGISNTIASESHGYNSITGGVANADGGSHGHNSPFSTTSGAASSNLLANSTSAGGPIAFVPRPHSHTQSHLVSAVAAGTSTHTHNGATVNMTTGGSHSADHSITTNLSGNLTGLAKHYQPFILMNYIMKV